jgi:methyl-accepting chemotaxis protein
MFALLSRLSIPRQFTLLGLFAVVLTLLGLGMTLKQSYDLALEEKRQDLRSLVESAASSIGFLVQQEKTGTLSTAEAQRRAKALIAAMKFDGNNYFFLYDYDCVLLSINERMRGSIGKNLSHNVDAYGHPTVLPMIESAKAGSPQYNFYYWPRPDNPQPQPKIGYALAIPEWQWVVGAGLYVDDIQATFVASMLKLSAIFVPLFLGLIAIILMMRRSVSKLLRSLTTNMQSLVRGDYETEIVGRTRRDEIGEMAAAVQVFKDNGLRLKAAEVETERLNEAAQATRKSNDEARSEAERRQKTVVAALAGGLGRLARRDLTSRLEQGFPLEYEQIRADFNATAESLNQAMRTIIEATVSIDSGSDQIAVAADDLSRRTEQQAASLEESAAALNLITGTVKKMAADADEAATVARATRQSAEASGQVVARAVQAMDKIKESSNQITQIIGVIDEIAFQTSLLALNAGVEAARAGEAGRGFAVVASEVRALAQRSAEAAKEIKTLISTATIEVDNGVAHVSQAGMALSEITEKVTVMDALIHKISTSSNEQSGGLAEINTAIGSMDTIIQQNAAMVEESTAAVHGLKDEAKDLMVIVGEFQTGTDAYQRDSSSQNMGRSQRASGASLQAPRAQAAKQQMSKASPRPLLRTVGSAAPKVLSPAPDEAWEEF